MEFLNNIIEPIRAMKLKYLPLLAIYFANSLAAFSQIAETFWIKNSLSLPANDIISITIWVNLPWSMKIVFGQILDTVKIFGSQRNIYIYFAGFIMLVGNVITACVANNYHPVTSLASTFHLLVIAGTLVQIGFVIQDLIADTLCYEVVDKQDSDGKARPETEVRKEINNVQILARFVDIGTATMAIYISGKLATYFNYGTISYFIIIIALISCAGILMVRKEPVVKASSINYPIFLGGIAYFTFAVLFSQVTYAYKQEVIFIVGVTILSLSLRNICQELSAARRQEIYAILIVIFAFRAVPTYGPGIEWWQIDVLKFDPEFFATLGQIGIILSFIGLLFFAKRIVSHDIAVVLLIINTIQVILQLPIIGMAYGLHEWTEKHFGFGAKTIAVLDTTVVGPFQKLGFLVLCTAITLYAPKKNIASWFALTMSLMGLALVSGGRIIKRILSEVFVVERGQYEQIGELMIATTLINFLLPTIAILLFLNPWRNSNQRFTKEKIA
jgi:hypothetical protein